MLNDIAAWEKLQKLGIEEWLEEKKASGQIRQVGFSYHGNSDMFCKVIDAYDWDFCQIQYNYMDEHTQAGRRGLEYAYSKGIPVVIMEPLRGGKLVTKLPKDAVQTFRNHTAHHSPAQWAFLWLWDQKEVTVVLSGMNDMEMLKENLRTARHAFPGVLMEDDRKMLGEVAAIINSRMKVGCTGCHYCMPCPQGVDIPGTFSAYNRCYSEGKAAGRHEYLMTTAMRRDSTSASLCIECGKCERHCPQHIQIRQELKNARKVLETPVYKMAKNGVKLFHIYG
jgi:predicted aldo/keto reductase-like oxidoreductase